MASSEEIHEACTLENPQLESTSPQIRGTREADPSAKQPKDGNFPRCVVTVVYD